MHPSDGIKYDVPGQRCAEVLDSWQVLLADRI